ncbi:alanine racemase [Vineibacter terrae]|uniref:Alanine racemase n=1 Tax=Vineibacter terrae TaxID=2586908 RepID=A0A5C8PWQ6_9HYPH|nr:alanine racemase [Vineibacter terrae]TXL82300.1 alanine racemase [Vineibacter terrae]
MPPFPPAHLADAVLTVDLDAVAANWRYLRDLGRVAGRPVDCAAVLKADGYGLGAQPIAQRLFAEGCRHFFVAHADEGVALREAVPEAWICVLNGLPPGADADFVALGLVPALNDLGQVSAWRSAAQRYAQPLDAVVHLDTGMNRLGLAAEEAALLVNDRMRLRGLRLALLMSHLVSAEKPADPINRQQLERFRTFVSRMPGAPASLANSSGVFLGADFHFDLMRPGAALYGINPTPGAANPMRQAATLSARILQVRQIDAMSGVGYNHDWRSARPSRIAVVAAGYADGYMRVLGNRGEVVIDNHLARVVGRVSMDLLTVDVTDLPEASVRPGAFAELIGPHQTPDQIAEKAHTNGYEVLTSLGNRYHRAYVGAAP